MLTDYEKCSQIHLDSPFAKLKNRMEFIQKNTFFIHRRIILEQKITCLPQQWHLVLTMEHLSLQWNLCNNFGRFATTMERLPQLRNVCHNYGTFVTTMERLLQLWNFCHN